MFVDANYSNQLESRKYSVLGCPPADGVQLRENLTHTIPTGPEQREQVYTPNGYTLPE